MKVIWKRVILSLLGRKSKSILHILASIIVGLSISTIACYISSSQLYLDIINTEYPAKIWLMAYNEGIFSPDDDIVSYAKSNEHIVEVTDFSDNGYIEFIVDNHNNLTIALQDLTIYLQDNNDYYFGDATLYNYSQLIKSLSLSNTLQNIILISILIASTITFYILFLNNFSAIKKDLYILKRLGEYKQNITKHFLICQVFLTYIPIVFSSIIGLSCNKIISRYWVMQATQDFQEGSSLVSFNEQQQYLLTVNNESFLALFLIFITIFTLIYICVCLILKNSKL